MRLHTVGLLHSLGLSGWIYLISLRLITGQPEMLSLLSRLDSTVGDVVVAGRDDDARGTALSDEISDATVP